MDSTLKIMFLGATETVTGSCTAIQFSNENETHYYLVDIGEYQGEQKNTENDPSRTWLAKNAKRIKGIFITHAHYDHVGYLPEFVMKDGFNGTVYCTEATQELMKAILADSLKIKKIKTYTLDDIFNKIKFWNTDSFIRGKSFSLCNDLKVTTLNSAHVLGSATFVFNWKNKEKWESIFFSGDIGSNNEQVYSNILLKEYDYPFYTSESGIINIVLESTYGNRTRNKENLFERKIEKLIEIIQNARENEKTIIVPAFALNRAQEILFDLFYIQDVTKNIQDIKNLERFIASKMCPDSNTSTLESTYALSKEPQKREKIKQAVEKLWENYFNEREIDWNMQVCYLPENMQIEVWKIVYKYIRFEKLNIKVHSSLMEKINKIYEEHLLKTVVKKDGITLSYKYLSKKFFEKFELSNLSDAEKLQKTKEIITKILGNSNQLQNGKESKNISKKSIIVSSSGMCDEGKIIEVLKEFLPSENTVIVLTGYQAKNTNGYHLKNMQNYSDAEKLSIELNNLDLRLFEVKCEIIDLSEFYSGHADQDMLFEFVTGNGEYVNNSQTKVFLHHGQDEAKNALKGRLEEKENIKVEIPKNLIWYNLNTGEQNPDKEYEIEQKDVPEYDIKKLSIGEVTVLVPAHYHQENFQKIKDFIAAL